jgi:hypothetical protein
MDIVANGLRLFVYWIVLVEGLKADNVFVLFGPEGEGEKLPGSCCVSHQI